jgi:threonine/homoserine/homoserine lactone efflux protein
VSSAVLAFTVAAVLLAVTPGADTALVLRATARGGRAAGLGAVLGISTGVLTWGFASGVGLSTLLAASPAVYDVLRFAGAGYLGFLGVRSLLARERIPGPDGSAPRDERVGAALGADVGDRRSWMSGLRGGLLTNLLNPKIGVFYAALLPQFVPPGAPVLATSLGLTAIHVTLGTLWLGGVVAAVDRARGVLGRPTVRRRLERITGTVLIGFGVRLALAAR